MPVYRTVHDAGITQTYASGVALSPRARADGKCNKMRCLGNYITVCRFPWSQGLFTGNTNATGATVKPLDTTRSKANPCISNGTGNHEKNAVKQICGKLRHTSGGFTIAVKETGFKES